MALCGKSNLLWMIIPRFLRFTNDTCHDDVIKWKHFPRNWPFVRKIHRSPVNFPHKGQWRGALMFSLIYAWINDWANNREAGDMRRYPVHYDVIVMILHIIETNTMHLFSSYFLTISLRNILAARNVASQIVLNKDECLFLQHPFLYNHSVVHRLE